MANNNGITEYHNLVQAMKILREAAAKLNAEDGPGFTSPAWSLVHHAEVYLHGLASAELRGPGPK